MNIRSRVLVTGSDGFVGRHLVPYLAALDYEVIAASRAPAGFQVPNVKTVQIPDLSVPVNWHSMLLQCDIVVHLAGIAHETAVDDLYDRVNHQATAALAYAAQRCGVKHLIFISSIAAQCGSFSDHELTEDDPPRPNSAYGRSKLAAENAIRMSGVSFTILRPVLIYGGDNKGRGAILQMISRLPIPLPFGRL
jgi:nucleoside-diphosphate-sugar epimerase